MFNINLRSKSEELNYIHLLTLKIFNINLRSRSEEQNYLHGCSQYVQYQPTFKIIGTKLYTSAYPQDIQYQPYVQDLKNKTIYTVALSMFNINLRSRSAEQIYTPLLTLSIFILSLRLGSDVLKYLHGCSQYVQYQPTFKICGIKLYTSAYP